ncbi:lysozyme [Methylobacterium sp. SD274]|uniref:lysozyme n=1 Tax=Methylobacterium sp. SD274 TaxID=2782009 RepID=UPI001A96115F|nr:lysozyme [Methylobacterium sp. SD274]MBO1021482.1 lysozyme [Methylobacterium sp. SD274]
MGASAIMTPFGLAALKSREGVRLKAYLDSVGVPTIGYGHIKGVKLGQVITQAQADAFFLEDLASHALPILSAIKVPVADHERDALISIAFNIGVGGFTGSTFLRRLNAGDRAGCAEAIMMWKKPEEIIFRRTAERAQFLTPYSKAAPKARSTDAKPVSAPLSTLTPIDVPPIIAVPPAPVVLTPPAPSPVPVPATKPLAEPAVVAQPNLLARFLVWLDDTFGSKR